MSATPTSPAARSAWWWGLSSLVLASLIVGLHGLAVGSGLFMDDYAHFRQLREADWSLGGLTAACRLELIGGVVDLWWLPETTLRFFRPVAFAAMKLVYELSDWSPVAQHTMSLVWHLGAGLLLTLLLMRLGLSRWLALGVAGLYAIHPGHVATVQWIACQTELMVTVYLLGALMCFGRFRGWPGFAPDADRRPAIGWAVGAIVLFVLALGCRENAVMFPFVVATLEPLVWNRRRRAALALYGVMGLVLVGYVATRSVLLGGLGAPPRPYVMPLTDPDFPRFVFDKAWYYLIGEFLIVPVVPIAGLPYLRARPWLFYGFAIVALCLVAAVWLRHRSRPAGILGPAWLLGFMAPILPVFSSPHHLYLPGAGWAIVAGLILDGIGGPTPATWTWRVILRRTGLWLCVAALGGLLGIWTYYSGLALRTGARVEDRVIAEAAAAPSGLKDGDTLYIANLPLIAHYVRLGVEERTGVRDLQVVALTWSPRLLGLPPERTELTRIDDHTIEMRIAGGRYFADALGRLAHESSGGEVPDEVDRRADLGLYVRVLERDADGVAALRFEFEEPLNSENVHLLWGSRVRWAYEIRR